MQSADPSLRKYCFPLNKQNFLILSLSECVIPWKQSELLIMFFHIRITLCILLIGAVKAFKLFDSISSYIRTRYAFLVSTCNNLTVYKILGSMSILVMGNYTVTVMIFFLTLIFKYKMYRYFIFGWCSKSWLSMPLWPPYDNTEH